ncbi:MAG TPA: DNA-processing protein DprA [Rhodanobacteraceae bacterium]|nr:DNA-processing protein DprA [Rhodanobacteraceae bacterium]
MRMDIASNRADIEAWLILLRTPGFGSATLRALIDRHRDIRIALDTARNEAKRCGASGRSWLDAPDREILATDLDWLAAEGHQLLTVLDADFPPLLRDAPGAPVALFVCGDAGALWQPQIAIVGSRNASHAGLSNAKAFAKALCAAGFAITSGLAEGIDAAAHAAALDAGAPTVAVLGTGPDLVYPSCHRELASRIAASGALVSEFPPGTPGKPEHFPRRNRIIAGLSLGTLIVEAGLRSGSLITARCAVELGRDVFAIPGSIQNPLARGCHRLIRQGAALVETAEEIATALGSLAAALGVRLRERLAIDAALEAQETTPARDPDHAKLLDALGDEAVAVDTLAARTGIGVAALSSMLLVLELEGAVVAERGGTYLRRPP